MKLWDLRTGRVMRTIENVGTNVRLIRPAMNNALIVTVEGSIIKVWNIRYNECVSVIDKYIDPPEIGIAGEGVTARLGIEEESSSHFKVCICFPVLA
jgi:WD40 repeat protein